MQRHTHSQRGVVLLEAIIAVGVLVLIVGATLSLITSSSAGIRNASDRLVATYLAQDAIEWLIARRDYNFAQGSDWLLGIDGGGCAPQCAVETSGSVHLNDLTVCPGAGDCALYTLNGSHWYTYTSAGAERSPFTRSIDVAAPVDLDTDGTDDTVLCTVTVSWQDGNRTDSVVLTHTLYHE